MRDLVLAQDSVFPEWRVTEGVGNAATAVIDFFDPVLDVVDDVIQWLVDTVEGLLMAPPDVAMIAILTLLAWWARGWGLALFSAVAFSLVAVTGFWPSTVLSLSLVLVATLIAVIIGVPLGILAARSDRVSPMVRPVLDFMQTMPSFVYLLVVLVMFGIGATGAVLASVVFAMPPAVRLTELGIRQVDAEVVEAANAFGATPGEILRGVQFPLALPTIMAGVNQVIMLALSMVVIAGLVGAGGLGEDVVEGITRYQLGLGLVAGLGVVILAVFLDRTTSALGRTSRAD